MKNLTTEEKTDIRRRFIRRLTDSRVTIIGRCTVDEVLDITHSPIPWVGGRPGEEGILVVFDMEPNANLGHPHLYFLHYETGCPAVAATVMPPKDQPS